MFKGFQSFLSPSCYRRRSAGYCSAGADEALQRRAAGQGAVCFREEDHVCCPHGVRHRPRASVLVRDQHDEDALRKKQMPLVQNKVTLSRTILGRSMTPCKRSSLARYCSTCTLCQFAVPTGKYRALWRPAPLGLSTPPAPNAFSPVFKLRAHGGTEPR
jgi:hypothetical protein